ncbi:4'-phosphopantetheinyl transferase family protein [Bacillus sp. 2205SS5-2]|uniref:4'-phosphopantetheinyl transferase family protein n=1 Tax=Bacillus sp. 2205SS5-2 TaxID=3109031 RepID=UPI003006481E
MSNIYSVYLNKDLPDDHFDRLLSLLTLEKQEKIKRFVFPMDALRSLVAELLSRYLVGIRLQLNNDQIHFEVNSYGKPFVKGPTDFHFNVSHAGTWVVCAIDTQPIGVDVEKTIPIDLKLADHFFSIKEQHDLNGLPHLEQQSYFFDLWCLKESYIKMVGKGLSIPLDSFTFSCLKQQIFFCSEYEDSVVYSKTYNLTPEYKMAVCQRNANFTDKVHNIPFQTLVNKMLSC